MMSAPTGADRAGKRGSALSGAGAGLPERDSAQNSQSRDCAGEQHRDNKRCECDVGALAATFTPLPFGAAATFFDEKLFPIFHAESVVA